MGPGTLPLVVMLELPGPDSQHSPPLHVHFNILFGYTLLHLRLNGVMLTPASCTLCFGNPDNTFRESLECQGFRNRMFIKYCTGKFETCALYFDFKHFQKEGTQIQLAAQERHDLPKSESPPIYKLFNLISLCFIVCSFVFLQHKGLVFFALILCG
jgi:hypothetical protein